MLPNARRSSLEYRVPALITALLVGLLLVTVLVAYGEVRSATVFAVRERLERVSAQLAAALETSTEARLRILRQVAADPAVVAFAAGDPGADADAALAALEAVRTSSADSTPVALWGSDAARPILRLPGAIDILPPEDDSEGEGGYGAWVGVEGRVYSYVWMPVVREGEAVGRVVQLRALGNPATGSQLEELIGPRSAIVFVDEDGRWASFDGVLRPGRAPVERNGAVEYDDALGERQIGHTRPVAGTPWTLLIEMPLAAALERPHAFLRRSIPLLLGLILMGAAAAWLLSRRFTLPLRDLSEAAEAIAGGHYGRRVDLQRADEIGALAETFNTMAARVEASDTALRERVTQAHALADELEIANDRLTALMVEAEHAQRTAEGASRAKSDFLATISHEIRTPINAILGYADLMLAGIPHPASAGQRDQLERLMASGRHLSRLIEDVLDLSKIEAGHIHLAVEEGRAEDLLESTFRMLTPLAREKGIELKRGWAAEGDCCTLRGDTGRVEQILVNLVTNAIKFTPAGGTVSGTCGIDKGPRDPAGEGDAYVWFRIRDDGIGIAEHKLDAIFDRFVQAESGYRREHGGAGLGLAISRELARLMGGDVGVESREGEGSLFTLWVPTEPSPARSLASTAGLGT